MERKQDTKTIHVCLREKRKNHKERKNHKGHFKRKCKHGHVKEKWKAVWPLMTAKPFQHVGRDKA